MASVMTSKKTLEQYQEDFYDEVFDFFGGDIIGSDTHPLRSAFNRYVEMKKDQETDDEEEEEPICCVGCGKDGLFKENRDGDTMCPDCHSDDEEKDMLIYYKCKSCDFATDFTDPECSKCKKEMERIVEDSGNYSGNCLRCCECEKVFLGEDYLHWEEFEYICMPCVKKEGLDNKRDVCQECYSREHCKCEDKVEAGKCEDCGNECRELDDILCVECYDIKYPNEEDEIVYTYYKCEHCGFATHKDDTDCSKCKIEMC